MAWVTKRREGGERGPANTTPRDPGSMPAARLGGPVQGSRRSHPDFTWRSFEVLACSSAEADAHAQARRGSQPEPLGP